MAILPESLIDVLRARGLVLRVNGNRLQVHDADGRNAWPQLDKEEQAAIRKHRQRLKRLTLEHPYETPEKKPAPPTVEPVVEPEIDPAIRSVIFANTEAEKRKRAEYATKVMYRMLRFGHPRY